MSKAGKISYTVRTVLLWYDT